VPNTTLIHRLIFKSISEINLFKPRHDPVCERSWRGAQ
jgi:hypothetical protein